MTWADFERAVAAHFRVVALTPMMLGAIGVAKRRGVTPAELFRYCKRVRKRGIAGMNSAARRFMEASYSVRCPVCGGTVHELVEMCGMRMCHRCAEVRNALR